MGSFFSAFKRHVNVASFLTQNTSTHLVFHYPYLLQEPQTMAREYELIDLTTQSSTSSEEYPPATSVKKKKGTPKTSSGKKSVGESSRRSESSERRASSAHVISLIDKDPKAAKERASQYVKDPDIHFVVSMCQSFVEGDCRLVRPYFIYVL